MKFLKNNFSRLDVYILIFMLSTRIFFIWYLYPEKERFYYGDSAHYEGIAINYLKSGNYIYPEGGRFSDIVRTPGYPAVIMATYLITGEGNFLLVVLLNLIGIIFLYAGIKKIFEIIDITPHIIVFIVFALDFGWFLYSKSIMSESIFAPILVWSVIFLLKGIKKKSIMEIILSSILMAFCSYIKPISLYLPLLLILILFFKLNFKIGFIYFFIYLILLSPWYIRNKIKYNTFTFTEIQNKNLSIGHLSFIYADIHKISYQQSKDSIHQLITEEYKLTGNESYKITNAALFDFSKKYISKHPFLYIKVISRGMLITLFDPGRLIFNWTFPQDEIHKMGFTDTLGKEGVSGTLVLLLKKNKSMMIPLAVYFLFLLIINGCSLLGVIEFYKNNKFNFFVISLIFLYLWILGGPNGYARFRLYLFPFLLIYFNYGFYFMKKLLKHFQR